MNSIHNAYTNDLCTVGDLLTMTYKQDADHVKKESCRNESERRAVLIEIIVNNPNIQHTHILKQVVERGLMAKKTAEKLLNIMEAEKIIVSNKIGDSANAKRHWRVNTNENSQWQNNYDATLNFVEYELKKLGSKESTMSLVEQGQRLSFALMLLDFLKGGIQTWNKLHKNPREISTYVKRIELLQKRSFRIVDEVEIKHIVLMGYVQLTFQFLTESDWFTDYLKEMGTVQKK